MLSRGNTYRHQCHGRLVLPPPATYSLYDMEHGMYLHLLIVLESPDLRGIGEETTVVLSGGTAPPERGKQSMSSSIPEANARWAYLKKGNKNGGYGAAVIKALGFKAGDKVIVANRYGAKQEVVLVEMVRVDEANPAMGKAEEEVWTTQKV